MKGTVEMEYAILDICSLECVFKWSVSRPISGSSESILARYVSQVVSKHTKLGSRGAECCKRAETYWPEGLDAKWSVIWKCLLKILLLPPSTLPFQQRKKRENVLSYFLVWTQYSSYCHFIFNAQWPYFFVGICTQLPIKEIRKKKKIYPIYMNYVRCHPHPKLENVNLPPETGPILDWLVTLWGL